MQGLVRITEEPSRLRTIDDFRISDKYSIEGPLKQQLGRDTKR